MRISLSRWLDVLIALILMGLVLAELITNLDDLYLYIYILPAFGIYAGLLAMGNVASHLLGIVYAFVLCIGAYVVCDIGFGFWFLHEFHDSWYICAAYGLLRVGWEVVRLGITGGSGAVKSNELS